MAKITIMANKRHEKLLSSIEENVLAKYPHVEVNTEKEYTLELDFTKSKKEVMSLLALAISSYIVVHVDDIIIRDAVNGECFDLPEGDIEYMIAGVKSAILQDGDLYTEVLYMLDEDKSFNLSGFLKFRNKDRQTTVREISHKSIDDFFTNNEIEQFIQLVQRFMYIQLPKAEYAHIIEKENGEIEIFTDDDEKIDLDGLKAELEENLKEVNFEINIFDLIMSAMLSLLPKVIHLHFPHHVDADMEYLLRHTFEGKAEECQGCDFCLYEEKNEDNDKEE